MASKVSNHISACESPYRTMVWVPWGSPKTHAGTVVTARCASHPTASAGRPPQSLGAAAKVGLTSAGTLVSWRAWSTAPSTWAGVAGGAPEPGRTQPAVVAAVALGAAKVMMPSDRAVTTTPVPTLAHRTRERTWAWRIGFST